MNRSMNNFQAVFWSVATVARRWKDWEIVAL